jgi:hypothetical protein
LLQRTQRAVTAVGGDEDPLGRERDHGDMQQSVAPAGQGAAPHMGDCSQEPEGNRRMRGPPRACRS